MLVVFGRGVVSLAWVERWLYPPVYVSVRLGLFLRLFCCLAVFCGLFGCCFGTE